jgi:hypothetical protein
MNQYLKCRTCHSHELYRVKRSILFKLLVLGLPVKKFVCAKCKRITYLYTHLA